MGYDLHITRKENWLDASQAIDLDEWLEYVDADPDLQHDGFAETPVANGAVLRAERDGICVWTGYSGGENAENKAWLMWNSGSIVAKSPDEEVRQKMWCIAQALGAKVQGDEGEYYGEDGRMIEAATSEVTSVVRELPPNSKRPWWKFW